MFETPLKLYIILCSDQNYCCSFLFKVVRCFSQMKKNVKMEPITAP